MKRIWLGALALFLLPLPSFAQYDGFTGVLGTTTFLGPLIGLPADNCATPPFTFNGDLTSGLCSTAVGSLGLQASGYKRLHVDGDSFIVRSRTAVPTALTAGAPSGGAGNIDNGVHSYKVTFVTASGETTLGAASNTLTVVDKTVNGKCALSAIPLGQTGVVTDRKIYRTLAGGAVYYFIAALGNNTATTYTDNISDATALAGGLSPAVNSTNDFRMVVAPTSVQTSVPLLLPDGSAAAPSLASATAPAQGMTFSSNALNLTSGSGTLSFTFGLASGGFSLGSGGSLRWSSAGTSNGTPDTILSRDAANTLALRNSTNAQTFNIYNTYTDASNYERLRLSGSGATYTLTAEAAGTGIVRSIVVGTTLQTLQVYPQSDSATDIGAETRKWRTSYASTSIQGSKSKSLTDAAAAVAVTRIAIATNSYAGGEYLWTATSTDATDYRALTGRVSFSGVNKGGTVTCAIGAVGTPVLASSNANTLACTISIATSTTNCDIQATCTDNTAGSQTITINGRLDMPLTNTVTPQ